MRVFWIVLVLVLVCATPVWAHDCWLQPDHFKIGLDTFLIVRLLVGDTLKREKELPLETKMTSRLSLFTRTKQLDLLPLLDEANLPAITILPSDSGTGLVAMDRNFTDIILKNDKFSSYITGEHHSQLIDRVQSNPRGCQKEEYARCIKTIFHVGEDPYAQEIASQAIGQKLEIILLSCPKHPDPVRVKVLFDNKPLPQKTVTALMQNRGIVSQTAITGEDGEAVFKNMGSGLWLIRLVHLFPCEEARDIDWTSYWASFCFQMT